MFIVLPLLIISKPADAWTDRGHEITTLNAVRLLGDLGLERWSAPLEVHGSFLVKFANYPDSHLRTIRPKESLNHVYYQNVSTPDKGRAPERISELYQSIRKFLGEAKPSIKAMTAIGLLSHYSTDVMVPFHSSAPDEELHHRLENKCVPALEPYQVARSYTLARSKRNSWPKAWSKKTSVRDLVRQEFKRSFGRLKLYRIETQSTSEYCSLVQEHLIQDLARASLFVAHLWYRALNSFPTKKWDNFTWVQQWKTMQEVK